MAEVIECKQIIVQQSGMVAKAITEFGSTMALRATGAQLDLELEALMLDARCIVANAKLAALAR